MLVDRRIVRHRDDFGVARRLGETDGAVCYDDGIFCNGGNQVTLGYVNVSSACFCDGIVWQFDLEHNMLCFPTTESVANRVVERREANGEYTAIDGHGFHCVLD